MQTLTPSASIEASVCDRWLILMCLHELLIGKSMVYCMDVLSFRKECWRLALGVQADDFGTQIRFLTSVAIPTDLLSSNIFALIGLPKCGIICFGLNLLLDLILREWI